MRLTITEALADIKTIDRRVESKREFIRGYLWRQFQLKDPLEKEGGSRAAIAAARQGIADLEVRRVRLRAAIAQANATTPLSIDGTEQSVADWLTWRREVADGALGFLKEMRTKIQGMRTTAQQKGIAIRTGDDAAESGVDVIVNIDELALAKQIETVEEVLGTLDGRLSLLNATTFVEVLD